MSGLYPHIRAYTSSLLLLLGNLGGNSVHISGSLLGQSLTHKSLVSVLVFEAHLTDKLSILELNEAVSDAFTRGESGVLGAGTVSLLL